MINLTREEAQQVLDALNSCEEDWIPDGEWETRVDQYDHKLVAKALEILRPRLAQPEREWQGLTTNEMMALFPRNNDVLEKRIAEFALAIEAKLKEKNG